jgi:hypothetical protein
MVAIFNRKAGIERTSFRTDELLSLEARPESSRWRRSYWPQTTDFTCGPSCLLMAAQLLGVDREFRQVDEYLIWRRANTVFMGEGQPGCSPEGLGLAALRLGLEVTIYQHEVLELLQEETGSVEHKHIMRAVVEEDRSHFLRTGGQINSMLPSRQDLWRHIAQGNVSLCLVREFEDDGSFALHWVVLADIGASKMVVLNPWNQGNPGPVRLERFSIKDFSEHIRHGSGGRGAVLVLMKRRAQ